MLPYSSDDVMLLNVMLVSDLQHPVQSQCHELGRRLVTCHSRRRALVHGTNCHHRFVALLLLLLLNVNSDIFIQSRFQLTLLGALVVSRHLRRPNLDFFE